MKNIHVLPTDKPSRVFITKDEGLGFDNQMLENTELDCQNQHIYITSDEEIVLNCYHFNSKYGDEPQKTNQRDIDSRKYWEEEDYYISKIILTTDQDLIADGVQAIDDEFLEWFVKNPSCEFVDVEVDEYRDTSISDTEVFIDYKIIIPKEESKQECMITKIMQMDAELAYKSLPKQKETLEEASFVAGEESFKEFRKGILEANRFDFVCGFTAGAKWQQEQDKKLYSEEEVRNIVEQTIEKFYKHRYVETKSEMKELWFQQFKKK
jgi:hypothetical protein